MCIHFVGPKKRALPVKKPFTESERKIQRISAALRSLKAERTSKGKPGLVDNVPHTIH